MPEYGVVPETEIISLDAAPLKLSSQEISNEYALTKVLQDFYYYERERTST